MRKRFLTVSTRAALVCGIFAAAVLTVGLPQRAYAQASATTANAATITGTVTDAQGEPLIGATVAVKGTANACATDIDGNFSLKAPVGSTLAISYVGYKGKDLKAEPTAMNIVLDEDSAMLDEVVVVGYGTAKKESLSGA